MSEETRKIPVPMTLPAHTSILTGALPREHGVHDNGQLVGAAPATLPERLAAAGWTMDHPGGTHPHRRSAYYCADELVQIEFVQYLSARPEERNDYAWQPAAPGSAG